MSIDLQREQRLLQQALATGIRGEQRRVQTALLRETERAQKAVDAGWEPFEPAAVWHWGYVEDPRLVRGRSKVLAWGVATPLAVLTGIVLRMRWEALAAAATAAVLLLGLQTALHELIGRIGVGGEDVRVFNAPMPAHAVLAYRRAKESGVFDTFVVHSPRAEDFRAVSAAEAPSLGLLDPVLAGRIGRHSFLIAQWDLAKDLEALT